MPRAAPLQPEKPTSCASLAGAPLDMQINALKRLVMDDPDLMALLIMIRDLDLPDGWLTSGCLYQTVWNAITERPRRTGIKDYDVLYFDSSDLSYEAEDRTIQRVARAGGSLAPQLEVRNQARVHLWFRERFGFSVRPLSSAAEAMTRYASTAHAIGVRLTTAGELELVAPYGLRDVFAMHVRPNRMLPNGPTHNAKARRCLKVWPELTVEWW